MSRATILCVVGTRPEAIKLAPIILALEAHAALRPVVVSTGQHRELLRDALAEFGIAPEIDLDVMQRGQSPADVVAATLAALVPVISAAAPAAVVVQGDTATAFAAAQAAAYARVPVAHVEAGLRSGSDEPFPEEMHRRVIAQIASLHFAPTTAAARALANEGISEASVHITGNSGIDALVATPCGDGPAMLTRLDPLRRLIVVTVHRRENHGAPLRRIAAALRQLADGGAQVVLPLHPHPDVCVPLRAMLGDIDGIRLVPPLPHRSFIALLRRADVVLTDSGGVQEEAPALGVPVLVLREVTERGEGLASGHARLVGTDTARIVAAVRAMLDAPVGLAEPSLPYGDGAAAPRIVAILARSFASAPARAELVHQA